MASGVWLAAGVYLSTGDIERDHYIYIYIYMDLFNHHSEEH